MAVEEVGVKLLAENSDKFSRDTKAAQRALDSFIHSVESGAGDVSSGMKQSERAVESFATSSEKSFRRIDAFAEIAIGALRRVGEVAVNALFEAGRATADFIGDSVSVAGDFESTLNRFAAVTGDSLTAAGMDVSDFSDLFLEMGALTAYSAGEAAEAAVALAKGGITPAAIAAGGLEAALSLAAAGELNLAASADILAKQLGVWADKGVTAIQVTDLLAQAANASTVDVAELARGLSNVQGRAAAMGLEYEDLVQTMAVIAPGFSDAAQAGTSLNNFLARLIPTTDAAKEAMMDLGLVTADGSSLFFDAQGNFIGARDAIGLLSAATADLSEEEKSMAFQIIFGNDAMGAATLLAEKGVPAYDAMGESMDAAGSAADQAAKRNQGFNFALEEMGGSLETLKIVLGTALLPLLTEFIQNHITPGINKIMDFASAIANSKDPLATFSYLVRDAIPWFKHINQIFHSSDPLGTFMSKMDDAIPGFTTFLDSIATTAQGIAEFSESTSAGISALFDSWAPTIEAAFTVVGSVVTAVTDTISKAWEGLDDSLSSADISAFMRSFELLWTALQPVILGVLSILGAAILGFLGAITGLISGVLAAADMFILTLTGIATSISIIIAGYVDVIGGGMDLIQAIFQGNIKDIIAAFKRMGEGILELLIGALLLVASIIVGSLATVLSFIGGFVMGVIDFFKNLYHELVGGSIIPDMVNEILDWFNDLVVKGLVFIMGLVDDIKAAFDIDWGAVGRGIIDGITGGLTSAATGLADAAKGAARDAYNAVTDFLGMSSPSRLFMEVGDMTMRGLAIGIDEGALQPLTAMEGALSALAVDVPQMLPRVDVGRAWEQAERERERALHEQAFRERERERAERERAFRERERERAERERAIQEQEKWERAERERIDSVPQILPQMIADTAAPAQTTVNNYNGDTVYQGDSFGLNVRSSESTGTTANTVRALQAISRIRGR